MALAEWSNGRSKTRTTMTDQFDHIKFDEYHLDLSWIPMVDGMSGVDAHAVLVPRGYWPPTLNPFLVKEVVVEPAPKDHPARFFLKFIDY